MYKREFKIGPRVDEWRSHNDATYLEYVWSRKINGKWFNFYKARNGSMKIIETPMNDYPVVRHNWETNES